MSREKRIRTKGILLTRPYLRAYANAEQFATGICIDSGGDLYGIMSRHNLKTLCQLCTAFSSSHVSASSATPAFFFSLFSKPFQTFLSRRWRYSTFANNSMKISLSKILLLEQKRIGDYSWCVECALRVWSFASIERPIIRIANIY